MTQSSKKPNAAFSEDTVLKKPVVPRAMLNSIIRKHPLVDCVSPGYQRSVSNLLDEDRSPSKVLACNQRQKYRDNEQDKSWVCLACLVCFPTKCRICLRDDCDQEGILDSGDFEEVLQASQLTWSSLDVLKNRTVEYAKTMGAPAVH